MANSSKLYNIESAKFKDVCKAKNSAIIAKVNINQFFIMLLLISSRQQ